MSRICKHEFEMANPFNKDYSQQEYDLYSKLGMSIRKNLKTGIFEIIKIRTNEVLYSGTLEHIVKIANRLEGKENTWIECPSFCNKKGSD